MRTVFAVSTLVALTLTACARPSAPAAAPNVAAVPVATQAPPPESTAVPQPTEIPMSTPAPEPTLQPTSVPTPTLRAVPIATAAPTPTQSPASRLLADARKQFGNRLRDAGVDEFGFAHVDYNLGDTWDDSWAVRTVADDFRRFVPNAFAEETSTFRLRAYADFTDVRGNTSSGPAMALTVSRTTSESVKWSNIQTKDLGRILTGKDDAIFLHPALQKAWAEITAR